MHNTTTETKTVSKTTLYRWNCSCGKGGPVWYSLEQIAEAHGTEHLDRENF